MPADTCSEPPAHPVPGHRPAHFPAHGECNPRRDVRLVLEAGQRDGTPPTPGSTGEQSETGLVPNAPDQAVSRRRPLRRLALMIARPACVDIRARNPWVRIRLRFLGWKVRFTHDLLDERFTGPTVA